jgi:hypothetical protein
MAQSFHGRLLKIYIGTNMEPLEVDRFLASCENGQQISKYSSAPVVKKRVIEPKILKDFEDEMVSQCDLALKKQEIEKSRVDEAFDNLQTEKEARLRISRLNIDLKEEEDIDRDFLTLEKMRKFAIETGNPFASIIAEGAFFIPHSLNLFGGPTGAGKTAIAICLALSSAEAGKKTLYISNEENSVTHMLRASSISCGIGFKGISEYTDKEMLLLKEMNQKLRKHINFLDDDSAGLSGLFTTIEGWDSFFDKLESMDSKILYDNIIIDYYQGVFSSKKRPNIKDYEAQAIFVQRLERFREKVGIPIIIFAQLWDKKESFQQRIKGSKSIIQRVTGAFEIIPNFETSTSELKIHKARICGELVGKSIFLKRANGRFVSSGLVL